MKALLPIRHTQADLFICDLFEAWKDDMGSMEHPVFSLSTKPDKRRRKYEHNGNTVEIIPSDFGLATIHDKDILLYLASQFIAEIKRRQKQGVKDGAKDIESPSKRLQFTAYDFFVLTNRTSSKLGYQRLESALDRLTGTRIKTNLKTNGIRQTENFGLLDAYGIIREDMDNPKSRMVGVSVKLSDWFYNSLIGHEVLTIHKDYFRLRKPLERRVYEICRKHCGKQKKWTIGLDTLHKKTGYTSPLKHFRSAIKKMIATDHLPDYQLAFDEDKKDLLIVHPRLSKEKTGKQNKPYLKPQTIQNAKKILGREFDVYATEQEWREWIEDKSDPKSWDGAFIGFCKMKIA